MSPEGKDTHPGTKERPFATLGKSRQVASAVSRLGRPVTVYLREGTHYLAEPLVFTSDDSGSKNAPVTFQACENEKPVISGGLRLNLDWKPYKNGISQAQLPPGFASDQLFVNNERQILARYPDFDAKERIYNGYAADAFGSTRAKRWADPRGGFIHAMHGAEWGGFHFRITGKKEDGTILHEGGWQNNRPSGMHTRFRFVENIFEELEKVGG